MHVLNFIILYILPMFQYLCLVLELITLVMFVQVFRSQ
jgi:hypothetical protein